MATKNERIGQALFQSISDDGADWLFVFLPDDRWAITCNGTRVAAGTSEPASIRTGVEKFTSLTTHAAAAAICAPIVLQHLDRITAKKVVVAPQRPKLIPARSMGAT